MPPTDSRRCGSGEEGNRGVRADVWPSIDFRFLRHLVAGGREGDIADPYLL